MTAIPSPKPASSTASGPAWHTILIATFVVSITIYLVSDWDDRAGWIYVLILVLAATVVMPNFSQQFPTLFGNTGAPTPPPSGGPF